MTNNHDGYRAIYTTQSGLLFGNRLGDRALNARLYRTPMQVTLETQARGVHYRVLHAHSTARQRLLLT